MSAEEGSEIASILVSPEMLRAAVDCAEEELDKMEVSIPRLLLEILMERCVRAALAAGRLETGAGS